MEMKKEMSLKDFNFWSGAASTVDYLKHDELDTIEENLEELFYETPSETDINDFFWFEEDLISEWLGYNDFDEVREERA